MKMSTCKCGFTTDEEKNCNGTHNVVKAVRESLAKEIEAVSLNSGDPNINAEGYVYIGGSNLTNGNYGFRIDPSHAISVELNGRDSLYALGSTSGLSASILMTNLEQGM
jgi:hypothetical protein